MAGITNEKQANFINAEKLSKWKIKIFGLGSIGGEMVKQLALVGFQDITGYDFDTVDPDNIGSQVFVNEHIGMLKTEAIQKLMKDWYDFDVSVIDEKITEETEILPEENTIYFCGFDSLEARKILWDKLKNFPVMWSESRIGRTSQRFYIIDLKNRDEDWITNYEKTLDLNGPRTELQCGDKGCFPSNAELVSKIIRQFVNIAEKKPFATHMISDWGTPPAIFIAPTEDVPEEINWD
jgi:molybdopterin/thiamine biosynthesis adenylyltransferase